jgi:hypothetical protein
MLEKLPGLIALLRRLDASTKLTALLQAQSGAEQYLNELYGFVESADDFVAEQSLDLKQAHELVKTVTDNFTTLTQQVRDEIASITAPLMSKDYHVNVGISDDVRKSWLLSRHAETEITMALSDQYIWKYPLSCINVQHSMIVEAMTTGKLLYLVDADQARLEQLYHSMEPSARTHVRTHYVKEFDSMSFDQRIEYGAPPQWGLPEEQMAVVLCWNLFQRMPIEVIDETLAKIVKLLRPGGSIVCNYINGMTETGSSMVSKNIASWCTVDHMQQLAHKHGLSIVKQRAVTGDFDIFIQLTRPGVLESSHHPRPAKGVIKRL